MYIKSQNGDHIVNFDMGSVKTEGCRIYYFNGSEKLMIGLYCGDGNGNEQCKKVISMIEEAIKNNRDNFAMPMKVE